MDNNSYVMIMPSGLYEDFFFFKKTLLVFYCLLITSVRYWYCLAVMNTGGKTMLDKGKQAKFVN